MSLRIGRIKVNRGGPLKSDFDFEPAHLNLIYGPNETGKTYVVESLISFLFKTGSRAPAEWDLRDWDMAGKATVLGLGSDPVSFTTSGKKLEEYWEERGSGLPLDLSRLLVVRAGETRLAPVRDGVGQDRLKAYLSGEETLDRIGARISKTLLAARVEDSQIVADDRGEPKARNNYEDTLGNLQKLLDRVEREYISGDAYALRREHEELDTQVEALKKAQRYHAGQLSKQIEALDNERSGLPTEGELRECELSVSSYEDKTDHLARQSQELAELESFTKHLPWATQAFEVYTEVTSGAASYGPTKVFMLLGALFLAVTGIFGLLGFRIPTVGSAALSGVFFAIAYLGLKRDLSSAGENTELEKLKVEYLARFGSELTDSATLRAKLEDLKKREILASPLRTSLADLSRDTSVMKKRICNTLRNWRGIDIPVDGWRDTIGDLKKKIKRLEKEIALEEERLMSLGVPADQYRDEDPGEEWDRLLYDEQVRALEEAETNLNDEESDLTELRGEISQATGQGTSDWEELITALRRKRELAAQDYKDKTAEILAKTQVSRIIQQLGQEENTRIAEGLKREELTEPLRALTGRYRSIRLTNDKGLVLVSDQDEDYPLASMSTGVREQAFLALRMGFASIAMEGKTGFLILDDAFQHSDWNRRENLVKRTMSFVQSGWQVFYFTMDDHIRDLFEDAGARIGDGFRSQQLG